MRIFWPFLKKIFCQVPVREFFYTHIIHLTLIYLCTVNYVSTKSIFSYIQSIVPNFAVFFLNLKMTISVAQRSISQENAFKKANSRHLFFVKFRAQITL